MNKNIKDIDTKKFRFYYPYDYNSEKYCDVTIHIKEITYTYTNEVYYYINYDNIFSDEEAYSSHPLYNDHKSHLDGEIIFKNELTQKLIEFLIMDDEQLKTHTGKTTPMNYRASIMKNIANLWD